MIFIVAKVLVGTKFSKIPQYIGLGLYIFAEAVIFVPLLYIVGAKGGWGLILEAGIVTIGLFLGLTAVAFLTRRDFSFLLPILMISTFLVLGVVLAGLIFGFSVRSFAVFAIVGLVGGWILYNTSSLLQRYQPNQYIEASLV